MRRAHRLSFLVLLLCIGSLLGGCFLGPSDEERCRRTREYEKSRSIDALQVPADLDRPVETQTFQIPEEGSQGYPEGRPCLERPPDYFGRPVD